MPISQFCDKEEAGQQMGSIIYIPAYSNHLLNWAITEFLIGIKTECELVRKEKVQV